MPWLVSLIYIFPEAEKRSINGVLENPSTLPEMASSNVALRGVKNNMQKD